MAEEQPQPKKQRKRTHAQTAVREKPAAKPATYGQLALPLRSPPWRACPD